ncbi:hypothetical protein D3C81_1396210 [compost metagenome]
MGAHRLVEAAQEALAAVQQRGLRAQTVEDRGELDGDIAAADHQYALGQLLEIEGFVGGDRQLAPGDLRHLRPAADSDQDVLGAVALAVHLDLMGAKNARMPFQQGDAAVDQQVAVDAVEALDLAVLVGNQGAPVEMPFFQGPTVTCGLLQFVRDMRAVHQQFFRHAADVDAGATQVAAFGHCHFCAEARRKARCAHTARPGTNHEQIKIVGHFSLLARPSAYPD